MKNKIYSMIKWKSVTFLNDVVERNLTNDRHGVAWVSSISWQGCAGDTAHQIIESWASDGMTCQTQDTQKNWHFVWTGQPFGMLTPTQVELEANDSPNSFSRCFQSLTLQQNRPTPISESPLQWLNNCHPSHCRLQKTWCFHFYNIKNPRIQCL